MSQPPLVSSTVDLRDFAFMPLDVVRLRDSDLAALEDPAACWAAVLLWCASWHQVPAASLPNEDRVLANLAGFGRVVREWQKVRAGALRGWVLCDDGRLYHPVIAEKAREAWLSKLEQRWRTECARIKKHNDRHETHIPRPDFDTWVSLGCPQGHTLSVTRDKEAPSRGTSGTSPQPVPDETASKGQGEGQGQGQGERQGLEDSAPSGAGAGSPPPDDRPPDVPPEGERRQQPRITDPVEIIFGYGVPILMAAGAKEKNARSFLGKLRGWHGDPAVIDALRDCMRTKPLQPTEWLAKRLPPPPTQGEANADAKRRADTDAEAKRLLGITDTEVIDA